MVYNYLVLFVSGFGFPTTPPFRHPSFQKEGNFIGLVIYSILLLREGGVPLVGEVVGVILSFMFRGRIMLRPYFHPLCLLDTARRVPTRFGYLLIFN